MEPRISIYTGRDESLALVTGLGTLFLTFKFFKNPGESRSAKMPAAFALRRELCIRTMRGPEAPVGHVFCHEVRIDSIRPCRGRLQARGLVGEPDVSRPEIVARRAASQSEEGSLSLARPKLFRCRTPQETESMATPIDCRSRQFAGGPKCTRPRARLALSHPQATGSAQLPRCS
jgi:hypothetical protein